jgi:dihydroflavonol-4-reductase
MLAGSQCLVSGGTGFIGRYVVRRLLARGAKVRLACRCPEKARRLFGDTVELRADCRGVDIVFHLAGVYRFGRPFAAAMLEANVRLTEQLLEAARAARVERFVHLSSSGVLGANGALITERDFPAHVSPREPYRRSKWLGELAALSAARRGLPVVVGSPTAPLGAEDEAPTPTGRIVRDFVAGRFPFSTRTAINFVDVGELADGILALAERGRIGERYILGHHNVWLTDFLRLLETCAGRPAPRRELPWPLIAAAAGLGELIGASRLCWETARGARKQQFFDLRKASDELGWRAHLPLETSARAAVAWFRRQDVREPLLLAEQNVAAS